MSTSTQRKPFAFGAPARRTVRVSEESLVRTGPLEGGDPGFPLLVEPNVEGLDNHAHMFHVSNLDPGTRQTLLAQFAPDELPRNAFYGDGSAIPDEDLEEIRQVYRDAAVAFPWRRGDMLLLDNFLASHGREPFAGPRRIAVAMAELHTETAAGAALEEA